MAVAVKASTAVATGGSTIGLTVPATATTGDLLVVYVSGAYGTSTPAGWNAVTGAVSPQGATNISGATYWRLATSTDAGTTYNWAFGGTPVSGIMVVLTGHDAVTAPTGIYYYNGGGAPGTVVLGSLNGPANGMFLHFGSERMAGTANGTALSARGTVINSDVNAWSIVAYGEPLTSTQSAATNTWTNIVATSVLTMVAIAPAPDNFPGPGLVLPTATAGTLVGNTTESGEPGPGTNSAWAFIDPPTTGRVVISTVGSACDTYLNVYTGSSLAALTEVAADDDSGGSGTSRLVLNATGGTRYYVRVALKTGSAGPYQLYVGYQNRWLEEIRSDSAQLAWIFDSSSTSVIVPDASGNGRTGTWGSANEYAIDHRPFWAPFKGAYRGVLGGVLTSPAIPWPSSGPVTIEAMIYFTEYGKSMMFLSWVGASLDFLWGHAAAVGYYGLNNLANACSGPPLPSQGWHHFVCVFTPGTSSTTAKYYIDGVLQTAAFGGSAVTIPALGTAQFRVGHNTGGWETPVSFEATGVCVYFGELSASRIMAHYRSVFGTFNDVITNYEILAPIPESHASLATPTYDSSSWTTDVGEPTSDIPTKTAWAAFDGDGGTYQLDTIGSTYDTSVAVYTGAPGSLTLVAADSSSGGSGNAKLVWTTTPGTRYFLQVGASAGASPDSGTIAVRFSAVSHPTGTTSPAYYGASRATQTAFLLKGRSTKAFDALAGG